MNLGMTEMIFIFLLALVIFGPKKLPEIGRQLGKAMNEFKRASNEFRSQLEEEIRQIDAAEQNKAQAKKLSAPVEATEPVIAPPPEAIAHGAEALEINAALPSAPGTSFVDEQSPSPERAEDSLAAAVGSNGHAADIVSPSAPLEELKTQEFNG